MVFSFTQMQLVDFITDGQQRHWCVI